MNGLFEFALKLAQVPDKDVTDLDRAMPAMARLCDDARELEPIIRKMDPLIEQLIPFAIEAYPILKAAYPDMVSVLPTLEEFIQFVNAKKGI